MVYEEQVVLDIGCGTGEATSSLAQRVPFVKEICAVDKSREFIDYAQEMSEDVDINYQCLNAEDDWPLTWEQKFTMVSSESEKLMNFYCEISYNQIISMSLLVRQYRLSLNIIIKGKTYILYFD